jgi:hypothetical protein
MNPNPVPPAKPLWNPKDRAAPLKEEYLLFSHESTIFHHRTIGFLENHPELAPRVPELPDAIDTFTDKSLILSSACDFRVHNDQLYFLYVEGQTRSVARAASLEIAATPSPTARNSRLKAALPVAFDGTPAKARTFLAECRTFMKLNATAFPDDDTRILWTLQLCVDKSHNWKRVQMEILEGTGQIPDSLRRWDEFQQEFLLKWADLNSEKKARAKFAAGLKQTTSVRRYVELFDEVILEAAYHDPTILAGSFYEGLKWEVKRDLVGRTPNDLPDLKALAIQLDEERMGADRRDIRPNVPRTNIPDSIDTTRQTTSQVKVEVARVGTSLSADERARYMREGRCFGCGKPGHRRPDCPDGKSRAHIAAVEPVVSSQSPDTLPISTQSKN